MSTVLISLLLAGTFLIVLLVGVVIIAALSELARQLCSLKPERWEESPLSV